MGTRGISRRAFVAGLGAATFAHGTKFALAGAPALHPVDDIGCRIIDTSVDLSSRAEALRLAGIKTVIRYYAHGPGQWAGKVISKSELDALEAQNLSVAVVFQNNNNKAENFLDEKKKVEDAMWARTHANHLKQPEGTPIYFGADFNLTHWDGKRSDASVTAQRAAAVHRYFEYMQRELAKDGRKLGVYGCGAVLEMLSDVADYFWLSASADYKRSGEYYNTGAWHLYQNRVDLTRQYGDPRPCPIDTNLANPNHEHFGQWRRDGHPEIDTQETTRAVLEARSFVAVQQLVLYKDHPRRSRTLVKPEALQPSERAALRYALNVKILTEDDEVYGVSLEEGDTVRGYCHKSDLCPIGAMPLRGRRSAAPKSAALSPPSTAATYRRADTGSTGSIGGAKVPLPRSRPQKLAKAD